MSYTNKQVVLVSRPHGEPKLSDFAVIESEIPSLKEGEILLKTQCFSLDPYMRGRMNVIASYIQPFGLGKVLEGGAICTIEASKNPELKVGDLVLTTTGWQTHGVIKPKIVNELFTDPTNVMKLPSDIKPSLFLGALGLPGYSGYYGIKKIGEPKKGETVVVSAATGGVGSMAGQFAKRMGCYVVGIAGGSEKCKHAVEEFGFDVCVDRYSNTFPEDLKKACPKGIDIYFENVGGPVFFAVHPLLNEFARIAVCGTISWYNDGMTLAEPGLSFRQIIPKLRAILKFIGIDRTPLIIRSMIVKRLKYQGFLIRDHFNEYEMFLKEVAPLIKSGEIKYKEHIVQGIEKAPEAFCGLLKGQNFGKVVIEV